MSTAPLPWLTDTETIVMLCIFCPHCGEYREEEEFSARGQAHIKRPEDPEACSDEEWGNYMFFRKNPKGLHHELWVHSAGCGKFFNMTRDTVSYEIKETYKIGEQPSVVAAEK
tara:strand:+ start:120766 stop:121104 length:339 start_codon:yes stop_codon:yes gene_type:complete